jgi:CheY-like chemotaxis protein/HPt (histidine-containing phosphotransfer) domain-containing protein/two-component sensor histidine kinase
MADRQPTPTLPPQPAGAHAEPARGGTLRAEMLARIGHELRAPLNAVIGFIRLVEEGLFNTEAERRDFLASARQSALSMLDLINNILDLARIEAGRLALQTVEFSVAELVEEVAKSLAPEAHAKGVEIDALVDPALPPRLKGDPVRLRQVFTNLAGNAVKFTESGVVLLRVQQEQAGPETCHLRVTVQDTGIGVPAELQATLFDSYVQSANQDLDRRGGGLGLGLAIVRQIVEQMGGSVGLESRPQQGSTFWFTVTLPRGRYYSLRPRPPVPRLDGARLLLLDPRADTAQVLLEKLSRLDVAVRHVAGLDDALGALARAHADGVPIRAVLVNHHLRPDDALVFARRVRRERAWFQPDLVHMTIVGATGAVGALRDAGFTAFLTKPVSVENLGGVLRTLLARQGGAGVPNDESAGEIAQHPPRPQTPPARVLVAEDNPVNQRLLHALLSRQGYVTRLVSNGQEALAALAEQPFDLVLMDVQMPVLDGLAATRAIRAHPAGARVPILALTSDVLDGERERCLAAGMNDCLPKPIVPDVLQHKLSQWLHPAGNGAAAAHEPLLDQAHLDSVHAYVRDTDPARFTSWLVLFRAEVRTALDEIAQAGAACDAPLLRAAARRLALASGGFGAPRLHALAEQLAGSPLDGTADDAVTGHAELLAGLETTWLDLETELDTRYGGAAQRPADLR